MAHSVDNVLYYITNAPIALTAFSKTVYYLLR